MSIPKKPKVYAAMSGGVDSSVAAALLKKQGYDVTGVFFKPWLSPEGRAFCNWQGDKRDAARVAAKLGIKFKVWDFSKEYGEKVTKYMINSYRGGLTPNPDVMCNKEIKFGLFLKKALAEGADYVATGHYVRLCHRDANLRTYANNANKKINKFATFAWNLQHSHLVYYLLQARDKNKDQSYFLWTLTQKQLKHCLFPIGDYTKPEVRKMAKKFGLHTHAKKDSQGVCFVGRLDVKEFLKGYIKPKKGEIKLLETGLPVQAGKTIGYHDGAYYYTIGQRHGLDIKIGGGPYFVAAKDIKKNIIYVTIGEKNLAANIAKVEKVNWIDPRPLLPAKAGVKIRYRSEIIPAELEKDAKPGALVIKFKKPARAVAPGQSAVFYRGEEMLGGGVIMQ